MSSLFSTIWSGDAQGIFENFMIFKSSNASNSCFTTTSFAGDNGLGLLNTETLSVTMECTTSLFGSSLYSGAMSNDGNSFKIDELWDAPLTLMWKLALCVSKKAANLVWESVKDLDCILST